MRSGQSNRESSTQSQKLGVNDSNNDIVNSNNALPYPTKDNNLKTPITSASQINQTLTAYTSTSGKVFTLFFNLNY